MRLYLPGTIETLAGLHTDGTMRVGGDVVRAASDSEDEEYDALMTAAEAAAGLVATALSGDRRRVVVVAEVDTVDPPRTVALADVVAVHADPDDVAADGAEPDADLGWYATQEIPALLHR